MKIGFVRSLVAIFLVVLIPVVMADEGKAPEVPCECAPSTLPTVLLGDLLESVSGKSNKEFLVDSRVAAEVVIGQYDWRDVTYPLLHTVLRNNELAAVTVQGVVNVVPVAAIRQYPLPVLYEDDATMADDEWVTRIMRPKKAGAAMLVPVLRPLVPQQGLLSANPQSNTLMAIARYANAKRIAEMVHDMDEHTSESTE
jgi:general secretion pathway protein D